MNEAGFRQWLQEQGKSAKLISDAVCRLRRLQADCALSLDDEYQADGGQQLLALFDHKGQGLAARYPTSNLPIGKYHLAAYKLALTQYLAYKSDAAKAATSAGS